MSETREKRSAPLAMLLCGLLAVIAIVLTVFSDSAWKVPLLILISLGFILAEVAIARLEDHNRALRRQVARLEETAALAADSSKVGSPKGAYSQDDDGQRRLHISRLE